LYKKRLKQLRKTMVQKQLEAIIISKPENQFYLSGFTGGAGLLFISHEKAIIVTDFRYVEQARSEAPDFEIYELFTGNSSPFSMVADLVKEQNISNLVLESHHMTIKNFRELKLQLNEVRIIEISDLIEEMRIVKDRSEIEKIEKAQQITDKTFSHILPYIKPGVKELDIACEIEYYMKKNHAKGPAFDTIVVSGIRSSLPHGLPSDKKLALGDFITLDFGAYYDFYCSDMTRTVFIGKPTEKQKRIYNIVLEAQKKAIHKIKPGLLGKNIDEAARTYIEQNGFGRCFGHSLGHGVGIEIHEFPRLSPKGEGELLPGMVVTVEPGIYIQNYGGVRIEDLVVITTEGCRNLTQSPKDIIYL
jgi:Xaa-Pro aminopeptidase